MSLLNTLKTERKRKQRKQRKTKLQVEALEAREVLNATWSLNSGVLQINADSSGSDIRIIDTNVLSPGSPILVQSLGEWGIALNEWSINEIRFYGSDQADTFRNTSGIKARAYGYGGDDVLEGGWNRDTLNGQNGNDTLKGWNHHDYLYGGNGDDVLEGGNGNDTMYGQAGHDHLIGGAGSDNMYGGSGQDGMYGGSEMDVYNGGSDADRFLSLDAMNLEQDFDVSEDVHIQFQNGGSVTKTWSDDGESEFSAGIWTDQDVLTIDKALSIMAVHTGNNLLMQDADGSQFTFRRHGGVDNSEANGTFSGYNSGNVIALSDITFDGGEDWVFQTVFHEVGHNWGSVNAVNLALPVSENFNPGEFIIDGFRAQSGWTQGALFGETLSGWSVSADGNWSYQNSASFARNYGKWSPGEDWATAFAAKFMDVAGKTYTGSGAVGAAGIPDKIYFVNVLLFGLTYADLSTAESQAVVTTIDFGSATDVKSTEYGNPYQSIELDNVMVSSYQVGGSSYGEPSPEIVATFSTKESPTGSEGLVAEEQPDSTAGKLYVDLTDEPFKVTGSSNPPVA